MLLNFLTMYFFIILCVGIYIIIYVWDKAQSTYLNALKFLVCSLIIYIFGYMTELHSNSLETALFWNYFQYTTIPLISSVWLLMVLDFTGMRRKLKKGTCILFFIIPCITYVLRWTNHFHHLFYADYSFRLYQEMGLLSIQKGPWYYVQEGYNMLITFLITCIFAVFSVIGKDDERSNYKRFAVIGVFSFFPLVLALVNSSYLELDYPAIFLTIPIFLISYFIAKQDFLEVNSLARNKLFQVQEDALIVLNNQERIIDYNQSASNFFLEHQLSLEYTYLSKYKEKTNCDLFAFLNSSEIATYEGAVLSGYKCFEINTSEVLHKNRRCGSIKTIRDITQEVAEKRQLEHVAKTDALTRLYNRREFTYQATQILENASAENKKLTVLMLDIDYFKKVNDIFGHLAGDEVLKSVSALSKNFFRTSDIVARFGGEEFILLLVDMTAEEAFPFVERFRQTVAQAHLIAADKNYQITLSIGMTSYQKHLTLEDLISQADQALYQSKTNGRNRTEIYTSQGSNP